MRSGSWMPTPHAPTRGCGPFSLAGGASLESPFAFITQQDDSPLSRFISVMWAPREGCSRLRCVRPVVARVPQNNGSSRREGGSDEELELPPAICKLDTREAAGGFSPSPRTENPGEVMLSPGAGGDRGLQFRLPGAAAQTVRQRKNYPFLCLLFCSGPHGTGGCPPTLGR